MIHPTTTQTFRSAHISRVVLRAKRPTPGQPSNAHSYSSEYHAVKVVTGQVQYTGSHHPVPTTISGGLSSGTVISNPPTGATDGFPRISASAHGRLTAAWTRKNSSADGAYTTLSADNGASWNTETLSIPAATYADIATSPSGETVSAGLVGTALEVCYQGPGDASPGPAATAKDDTGAALSLDASSTFGISAGWSGQAPWLLHCLVSGESDTSNWVSYDACKSFTRVT